MCDVQYGLGNIMTPRSINRVAAYTVTLRVFHVVRCQRSVRSVTLEGFCDRGPQNNLGSICGIFAASAALCRGSR